MPRSARRPRPASIYSLTRLLALVGIIALTACSTRTQAPATGANPASDSNFPVTIQHALGTTEITKKPERVMTLGQGSAETVIALGIAPIGIEAYPWGSDDTGYLPWIYQGLTDRQMALPQQIPYSVGSDLDYEAIAALKPDVILAPWSGLTQEQYDRVSSIAPTVAYAKEPWVAPWRDQITVIGKALGMPDQAAELITGVEKQLSESARKEYQNLTFTYIYTDGPGTLGVFFPDEQRVAMVRALGLTVDPVVDTLRQYEVAGTDSAMLSLENADKLDNSDLIFTFYASPEARTQVESQSAYARIPAIKRGSVVAPTDPSFVTGSSLINPLTVPWTLERYIPQIDQAVEKLN